MGDKADVETISRDFYMAAMGDWRRWEEIIIKPLCKDYAAQDTTNSPSAMPAIAAGTPMPLVNAPMVPELYKLWKQQKYSSSRKEYEEENRIDPDYYYKFKLVDVESKKAKIARNLAYSRSDAAKQKRKEEYESRRGVEGRKKRPIGPKSKHYKAEEKASEGTPEASEQRGRGSAPNRKGAAKREKPSKPLKKSDEKEELALKEKREKEAMEERTKKKAEDSKGRKRRFTSA